MDAIGPRVGMCHCPSCDTFACRWCWAAYRGACPTCRDPFVVPTSAGLAVLARIGATRRHVQRAPLAFTALVASMAILALTLGGQFRPAGGTESPTQPPVAEADASVAPSPGVATSGEPTLSPTGSARPIGTAKPTRTTGGGTPADDPTPRPASRVAGATSTPAPTPANPTPPTPRPTPRPTPAPTPDPTPTPVPPCETVPTLIGETLANARSAWSAAGFTGAFVPAKGHDNMTVLTQSHPSGACLPPSTSIEVTYARP
jgi:hypothetical protein